MFHDLRLQKAIRKSGEPVSEDQEQAWLFQWAARNRSSHPALEWLFAIPNGGHRSKRQGALLKLTGVKRGVPDIFLPYPSGDYSGLWIELKSLARGARATKDQQRWVSYLESVGYRAVVCRGFEAARDEILAYLTLGTP